MTVFSPLTWPFPSMHFSSPSSSDASFLLPGADRRPILAASPSSSAPPCEELSHPPPSSAAASDLSSSRSFASSSSLSPPRAAVRPSRIKRSHREIDQDRRAKEAEAMKVLDDLTADDAVDAGRHRPQSRGRREKLMVLQAAIKEIQRLRRLVQRGGQGSTQRSGGYDDHRMKGGELSSFLPRGRATSPQFSSESFDGERGRFQNVASQTLRSFFLSSGLCISIFEFQTNITLETNTSVTPHHHTLHSLTSSTRSTPTHRRIVRWVDPLLSSSAVLPLFLSSSQ